MATLIFYYFMFVIGATVLSLMVFRAVVILSDWIKELIHRMSR